jgi:hypothetical protein
MENSEEICVIFHIIEDESNKPTLFNVYLAFDKTNAIDVNAPLKLRDEYFPKLKDKLFTYIILNIDNVDAKFLITLYYAANHITIIKSKRIGVSYEIINQIFCDGKSSFIEKIVFDDSNGKKMEVKNFDNIGNKYRKRFLIVNSPITINLPIKFDKIKQKLSYKIVALPENKTLVYEIKEPEKITKITIDLEQFQSIQSSIQELMKEYNKDKMSKILKDIKKYKTYFRQNLINKEDFDWDIKELNAFYHYQAFHLLLLSKTSKNNSLLEYFRLSREVYNKFYLQLFNNFDLNYYDKILAITALFSILIFDSRKEANKYCILGEYEMITFTNLKFECYKYAFNYINKIIEELKEESFIFLPLLQVSTGYGIDLNSDDNKTKVFELSMLNSEMIKRHLKNLIPNFLFRVKHCSIKDVRGATDEKTGVTFIYESTIFKNNIPLEIHECMTLRPKDSAVNITFTLSHEIFMHKNLRSVDSSDEGKITPTKFIGPKLNIKTFFYTDKSKFCNCLAIYKKKDNVNNIPEKGESGRFFEYFFEDDNNNEESNIKHKIIYTLKTYTGFGDLIDKVELIVSKDADGLKKYIEQKILDNNAKPLYEKKMLGLKRNRVESKDITSSSAENCNEDMAQNVESESQEQEKSDDKDEEEESEGDNYLIKEEIDRKYNIVI